MGVLHSTSPELWIPLSAHVVVGRSGVCHARLRDPEVSGEHARLTWREGRWLLRDLGSRNGTTVDGDRLAPGDERPLAAGATIGIGPFRLVLIDASGPDAVARRLSGEGTRTATGGLLALPDDEDPILTIYPGPDGAWVGERDGNEEEVLDGDVVTLGGEAWMLHLPRAQLATVEARPTTSEVAFAVTADEETVELFVRVDGAEEALEARAHYYTLLTLARARLQDASAPAGRSGWRSVAELCHVLRIDENKLNVDVFRCRQDLARAGLPSAAQIVERRRTSRELRFRPEHAEIRRLE